ncbi:filamentous hemagglutinin N-terminal domain-containing protein [Salmonella enterica]|nr:filamentous hemagglutinin N-terminal domain-containing protein [Salmonella enterica]
MNRIYKLKFDKRRNELVIVSEITAGAGKEKSTGHIADLTALSPFRKLLGTLTPVALLTGLIAGLLPAMVLAADLPAGGQIVGGQGSISTSGNQMTIHQQTQNMATNWHSFDIGKNNTVQFVQPDSSSVALNRVTGASGSQIMGTLKANGQVFILNPNGVLFGKDARVNVGGLVASTKNLSTADFMKGHYTLSGSGNPGAQIVNQGSLTTSKGGYIVLAGERVSNSGTVTTPSGKTVLAAGKTVTLQLDNGGLTSVSVNGSVVNALVENRGLISASNGQVYLTAKGQDMLLNTVVNNSGTVEAKGLASRGGEIVLNGGDSGVVSQSGHLLADSQTGQGGKITLEGQNIHLAGGSLTSATGKTGGGEVYVGGGWQGQDSHIKNALKVVMDKTATADVSATENGNGGTAVLWSDDYTNFRGTVLAKGGAQSGNGGRVETSSHHNLQAYGTVDASSPSGKGGEWLLDPTDVTIVGTGTDSNIDSTTNAGIFTPTASGAQILNSSIVSQLNAGTNVTVKTSGADVTGQTGNITVNANIVKTAGADAKLTLLADNNITTNTGISIGASDGKLNLDLLAGNTSNTASVVLGNNINISLNGGDFLAGAANPDSAVSLTYRNNGRIYGGNVTLNVTGGLSGYAYKVQADNDLTINGPVSGSTGWGTPLSFIAGGKLEINSPTSISLAATDTANGGGRVVISGDKGVSLSTGDGNILLNAASATTNSVNVSSGNGTVSMNAGGNITLVCATVTSGAGQDITLDAAGKNSVRVNITGSTINSNGGNITIDHAAEGQAMTILISGSTLNTSATNDASHKGNIALRAYNPNVDLTVSGLTSTVRNGGSMIDIGNNSNLTGDNITTLTTQNGINGKGLPLYMHGATLQADGNISLSGVSGGGATPSQLELRGAGNRLTSVNGNISLISDKSGVLINATGSSKANLTSRGNITFSGNGGSSLGVGIINASINATDNIHITGSTTGGGANSSARYGGIYVSGDVDFHASNGTLVGNETNRVALNSGGVVLGGALTAATSNILFDGNFTITGTSDVGTTFSRYGGGLNYNGNANITFSGGDSVINATGRNYSAAVTRNLSTYTTKDPLYIKLDNGANLKMNLIADQVSALMLANTKDSTKHAAGLVFSGKGNVSIVGRSNASGDDSETLHINLLNNTGLDGSFTVNATNNAGTAISIEGHTDVNLVNATITGISKGTGTGIEIKSTSGAVHLNNVTLNGNSAKGNGINVRGNIPINMTNSNLNGTSTSGNGSGVVLTAGSNYTLDGGAVTGKSVNGYGVLMTGPLTVNNGTSVTGTATGSGNGVSVSGNLATVSGDGIQITGKAASGRGILLSGNTVLTGAKLTGNATTGTGVNVSGNATLTNATVSGETQTGTGAVVSGKLTADNTTQVTGAARQNGGTGVTLNGTVTGGKVDGTATSGDAVQIADGGVLTNAVVTGNATGNGTGVALSGAVSLDKTTAESLNAVSSGGTGLSLEQSANVSVAGLDAVSTAELKGLSQSGSGITTAGNVAIRGIVLNGSASTDSGVGVTLGGNLTIGDDVSRVTAGATGSGTALVIDNATLQANGYAGTNKGPVILADASGAGGTAVKIQGDNQLNDVAIVGSATSDGGTGVLLGGQVTGANILGTAGSGTGVVVTDGTLMDGGTVKGRSHTGTGLAAGGNVTLNHALISGEAQGDSGTGVSLNGSITGGTVNGTSTNGDAVRIKDALLTGTEVNGVAQSGTGVKTQGNVTLKSTELSATSDNGITDLDVSGALNRDQYSVINAARIEGRENIHEPQPDTPPSPGEGGATGSGGNTTPDTGDSGGVAGGDTGETVTPPPGGNSGDAGNNGNTGSATGSATGGEGSLPENNVAQRGEAPGPAIRERMTGQMFVSAVRQQAVDAQVTRMNQAAQDGFHSAATPVVPVTGYQAKPQNVEISLCDEDSCQPESLDAARPAEGVVTSSASGK